MSKGRERKVAYRRSLLDALRAGAEIKCVLCGKPIRYASDLTVDHLLPKSKGGIGTTDNFAPAHELCNKKKGNSIIDRLIYEASS